MSGRASQRVGAGQTAQPHARRVNDVFRLQPATGSNSSISHGNAANGIALTLDFLPALAADGSSYAGAKDKVIIRRIHDGVRVHLSQIALKDDDLICEFSRRFVIHNPIETLVLCGSRLQRAARYERYRQNLAQQSLLSPCAGPLRGKHLPYL